MLLKISNVYAILTLLAGTAESACDGTDKFWSDIGDNSTIDNFFSQVCSGVTGGEDTGYRGGGCASFGENHIDAKFDYNAKSGHPLTYSDVVPICEELFGEVRESCVKGGSFDFSIVSDGNGTVSAYPNAKVCEEEA